MPKALTMEEKIAKVEAKREATKHGETQVRSSVDRGERARRGVFNGTTGKLKVYGDIPGYHLHILNDSPGRIEEALSAGYEFVSPSEIGGVANNVTSKNTDLGDKVRFLVGTQDSGGLYAYLMKIRQEWYDEDQTELQRANDRVDNAIKNGKNTKDGTNSDGFYIPREGISLKN
jgi:hypothetical protein